MNTVLAVIGRLSSNWTHAFQLLVTLCVHDELMSDFGVWLTGHDRVELQRVKQRPRVHKLQ